MVPNLNLSQECVCFLCPGRKGTLTSGVAGGCLTTYVEHGTSLFNVTGVRVCVCEHAESDTTVNRAERPREERPVSHNAVCVQKGCGCGAQPRLPCSLETWAMGQSFKQCLPSRSSYIFDNIISLFGIDLKIPTT